MKSGIPPVGVGHIYMNTDCMNDSVRFMLDVGMRPIFEGPEVTVLEMRGGTHIIIKKVVSPSEGQAQFDLMVDDLREFRKKLTDLGYAPSKIEEIPAIDHEIFKVKEPGNNEITFFSSHVSEYPV